MFPARQLPAMPEITVQKQRSFKFWLRNIRFAQYVGAVSIESYSAFSQLREDIFLEIRLLRAYSRHQETPLDFR